MATKDDRRKLELEGSSSSDEGSSSDYSDTENSRNQLVNKRSLPPKAESSSSESSDDDDEEAPVETSSKTTKNEKKKQEEESGEDDIQAIAAQEIEDKTKHTIYVEGISYDAQEGDLVTHFTPCGIVKEVRFPRYQDSGKPRGYAHIVFEDAKAVTKALKLDGKYLMGRYLSVKRAQKPRAAEACFKSKDVRQMKGCRNVFIKNLAYDVEEQDVRDALSQCGEILSVRLPMWNHTKKLKGFGYVEFSSEEEAVSAAKKSGMKIGNRMVFIDLDSGAPKASFRTTDGQYWQKGQEGKESLARKMSNKRSTSGNHKPFNQKRRRY